MFTTRVPLHNVVALLAILALAAAACGGSGSAPTLTVAPIETTAPSAAPPSSPAAASGAPSGPTVDARIVDRAFDPAELTITVGTTVVWTNTGRLPHTVTASDGSFKSDATMQSGDVYRHTFDTPGTYAYVCLIHASMRGTVVVTP